jgi:diguanylate cyclase (GGDEF)-like protein/PAS domain S-box-containing protein
MRLPRVTRWLGRRSSVGQREDAAFKILADNSADVIFHFGVDMKARYISPSSKRLLGWTPEEIVANGGDAGANDLLHPEDQPLVAAAVARHLSGEVDELMIEFRMMRRDGTPVWVETNCRTVRDPVTGRPSDLMLTMRDISLKKDLESELSALARKDGLTGLANRRAFDEFLDCEWARSLRDQKQLSLLLIDVDHFKIFNDRNGHQVGDDCLRTIAATLQEVCRRPTDLVARYGGEEFAVILADTGQEGAEHLARRLLAAVKALHISNPTGDGTRWVTASIGAATAIAAAGGTMKMPEGLLQAADAALYKAKAAGRNCVKSAVLLSPSRRAALVAKCG